MKILILVSSLFYSIMCSAESMVGRSPASKQYTVLLDSKEYAFCEEVVQNQKGLSCDFRGKFIPSMNFENYGKAIKVKKNF